MFIYYRKPKFVGKQRFRRKSAKPSQRSKRAASSQAGISCSRPHAKRPAVDGDILASHEPTVDISGKNALLRAVVKNDLLEFVTHFESIDRNPQGVNFADYSDRTALMLASIGGSCEIVQRLLDNKLVSLDSQDMAGFTALMHAAQRGHEAILKLLLLRKANFGLRNILGDTAIILAARRNQIGCLRLLANFVKNPEDWTMTGEFGLTAEQWAEENGHSEAADIIRQIVADQLLGWENLNARSSA